MTKTGHRHVDLSNGAADRIRRRSRTRRIRVRARVLRVARHHLREVA